MHVSGAVQGLCPAGHPVHATVYLLYPGDPARLADMRGIAVIKFLNIRETAHRSSCSIPVLITAGRLPQLFLQ